MWSWNRPQSYSISLLLSTRTTSLGSLIRSSTASLSNGRSSGMHPVSPFRGSTIISAGMRLTRVLVCRCDACLSRQTHSPNLLLIVMRRCGTAFQERSPPCIWCPGTASIGQTHQQPSGVSRWVGHRQVQHRGYQRVVLDTHVQVYWV